VLPNFFFNKQKSIYIYTHTHCLCIILVPNIFFKKKFKNIEAENKGQYVITDPLEQVHLILTHIIFLIY